MRYYLPSCDCGFTGKQTKSRAVAARSLRRHHCGTTRRETGQHVIAETDITWMRIAQSVTRDWMRQFPGDDRDDVLSDAMFGIAQAIRTWHPGTNVTLPVHARRRARYAIIDGYRQKRAPVTRTEWSRGIRMADLPAHRQIPVSTDALLDDHDNLPAVQVIDLRAAEELDRTHDAAELDALLTRLPPKLRELIILIELVGYSQADIAAEMGVTPSRVCQMHKEAMTRLRASVATKGPAT